MADPNTPSQVAIAARRDSLSFFTDPLSGNRVTSTGVPWAMAPWAVAQETCPPALRAQVDAVELRADRAQLPIEPLFVAPIFTGQLAFPRPDHERIWYMMPVDEDPLFQDGDGLPMPDAVLARLKDAAAAGIDFDTFVIAHETPMTAQAGPQATLAQLKPAPARAAQAASANLGGVGRGLLNAASLPLVAAGLGLVAGIGLAAAALPAVVGTALLLDPILFGVVTDPRHGLRVGAPAVYFYVAHWAYD